MEGLKLMLIDDEERFLSTTKKILTKKGYDVETDQLLVELFFFFVDFLETPYNASGEIECCENDDQTT